MVLGIVVAANGGRVALGGGFNAGSSSTNVGRRAAKGRTAGASVLGMDKPKSLETHNCIEPTVCWLRDGGGGVAGRDGLGGGA